jgi:hypothetical protein
VVGVIVSPVNVAYRCSRTLVAADEPLYVTSPLYVAVTGYVPAAIPLASRSRLAVPFISCTDPRLSLPTEKVTDPVGGLPALGSGNTAADKVTSESTYAGLLVSNDVPVSDFAPPTFKVACPDSTPPQVNAYA